MPLKIKILEMPAVGSASQYFRPFYEIKSKCAPLVVLIAGRSRVEWISGRVMRESIDRRDQTETNARGMFGYTTIARYHVQETLFDGIVSLPAKYISRKCPVNVP